MIHKGGLRNAVATQKILKNEREKFPINSKAVPSLGLMSDEGRLFTVQTFINLHNKITYCPFFFLASFLISDLSAVRWHLLNRRRGRGINQVRVWNIQFARARSRCITIDNMIWGPHSRWQAWWPIRWHLQTGLIAQLLWSCWCPQGTGLCLSGAILGHMSSLSSHSKGHTKQNGCTRRCHCQSNYFITWL